MAKVYLFLGNEEYLNKVKIERIIKESVLMNIISTL